MSIKRKLPERARFLVVEDYATADLNGKGGVVWSVGAVVELSDGDARWVNQDRPGTLRPQPEVPTVPNVDGDPIEIPTLGGI